MPTSLYEAENSRQLYAPRWWGSWVLVGIMRLCAALPGPVTWTLGGALGTLYRLSSEKRRHIVRTNLRLCFPDSPPEERNSLLKDHFRHYGRLMLGLGVAWWASEARLDKIVHIVGREHLDEAKKSGKSVIVLTGHLLGADLGGIVLSRFYPGVVMMKRIRNPVTNYYVWRGRTRFGGVAILREQGLRPMVRAMRGGLWCYYVPDEDLGPERSVFAPFLGVPRATVPVLGRLARLTGSLVVPAFARLRPGGGGYDVVIRPPLEDFPTGSDEADARAMNQALEWAVRWAPEQYMWTFRWFRSRPSGEPSAYEIGSGDP
ncbi:MAG: lysophospholipid acyltransferase family protein [Gammaproteobacteria bacterium]|nr:lysophospholipid acyltransferase family protein [Gammaproteobacteria bacterium]